MSSVIFIVLLINKKQRYLLMITKKSRTLKELRLLGRIFIF
ncbi:hypothetical protein D920_02329 [Enterococcus faecalis 13-SD-W-01]|nr:hypothetical protein D920_02329 [Enterococcus faecalis 13-SD-W-01]